MRLPPRFVRAAPLLLLAACATVQVGDEVVAPKPAAREASPAPAAPPAPTAHRVEADTLLKTASGASFLVPAGWSVLESEGRFRLEDPEHALALTLLEVPGPSAEAAVAEAWRRVEPDFARAVQQALRPPARDGWDELSQVVYETGALEARSVFALARRHGTTNYIALLDGSSAAVDRRGAQVNQVVLGFKPAALEEESFAGRTAHSLTPERLKALEDFVEEARTQVGIPGVALAVVQGGRVVLQRGFGVREAGAKAPVTPDTLFLIGSATKSLTTLLMARLVDSGKLSWDAPVTSLLPSFALADAEMTRRLTLQNTVCACTGMPRQDMEMLFEFAGISAEQRIAEMRGMQPTTGIGETFQYSNPMVSAGGYMAAHTWAPNLPLGQAYDAAMQALVFRPLGMTATTFEFGRAITRNHASPHGQRLSLEYTPIPVGVETALLPVRPAGGAWSNVKDMARYLLLELAGGRTPEGQRLLSEASLLKRREAQVKVSDTARYGLGLFLEEDHGVRVAGHGGNTLGFSADMFFLPEADVGAVLLTNVEGDGPFRKAVRRKLLEVLYDGKDVARGQLAFALASLREAAAKELSRVVPQPDVKWLKSLAGSYRHPGLGRVTLQVDDTHAVLDAGEWKSAVGQKVEPDGTRKLVLLEPPMAGMEFLPRSEGQRTALTLELPQQRYVLEPETAQATDAP